MVATAAELEQSIADFVRLLERELRIEAIVLYGSYVNGVPHEWSDIDVAVISPDFEGKTVPQRQTLLSRLTLARDRRIEPMGYPSSEYHNPGRHSFLGEIIRTGRVVYEASVH